MKHSVDLTAVINIVLEEDSFAYIDQQRTRLVRYLITEIEAATYPGWDPVDDPEVEILGRGVPYLKDGTVSTRLNKRWLVVPYQSLPQPVAAFLLAAAKQAFLP